MHHPFRITLLLFSLGVIMIFGCNRPTPPADSTSAKPAEVVLHVPGMF